MTIRVCRGISRSSQGPELLKLCDNMISYDAFFRSTTVHFYCCCHRRRLPLRVRMPANAGHVLLCNYLLLFPIRSHYTRSPTFHSSSRGPPTPLEGVVSVVVVLVQTILLYHNGIIYGIPSRTMGDGQSHAHTLHTTTRTHPPHIVSVTV